VIRIAAINIIENGTIPIPCWGSNCDSSAIQSVAYSLYRLSYPGSLKTYFESNIQIPFASADLQ
jgi:hypothetical protein